METNFLNFASRAGGILPLLIFFLVSLFWRFGRAGEWSRSFRRILRLKSLIPFFILLNLILYPLMVEDFRIGDVTLLSLCGGVLFSLNILTIPIFKSLSEELPIYEVGRSVVISVLIILAVIAMLWLGVELKGMEWLIFTISFGTIYLSLSISVKKGRTWSEVAMLLSNAQFVAGVFLLLAVTLILSIGFMVERNVVAVVITSVGMLASSSLVLLWLRRWDSIFEKPVRSYPDTLPSKYDLILSEEGGMAAMYGFKTRLFTLFDEQKPYLSPEFNISQLSGMLYTNKSYISKFLNNDIKMNFKEFVNQYRVKEAIRLYKGDPTLPLKQLYQMCGFRNNTSFTNAFRMYTGMTPGEWCRNIKRGGGDEKAENFI